MDMFTSISSKTLPFDSHIDNDNMGVYGDSSFSSLNPKDDNFICKFVDLTRYLNRPNLIPEEGEIGVFGAEKYFNGGVDDTGSEKLTNARKPPSQKQLDKLVVAHHQPRLGTPSVGSESSSINNQRSLLKFDTSTTTTNDNKNNNDSFEKRNNNNNKRFLLSTLKYCMCYSCNDTTVVDAKEDVGEISFSNAVRAEPVRRENNKMKKDQDQTTSFKEKPFSFPTEPLKLVYFQEEEVERKSLEVFGSSVTMGKLRNKPISLEKRLAMLSWDHTNNNSNNNNSGILFYNVDDEVKSDCSSDLFEIESLTKQTNPFQSPSPSCYAPSEASVKWSVVTASALDFEERRPASTTSPARVVQPRRVNVNKEVVVVVQKRRSSNSLLGCKNEKAVKVSEHDSNGRKFGS